MELKVWVDGIKRVVCGVTDNTTCQDIVIALAQAMGRTGRFTLMEKWRENERPLPPTECPLLVLQKWGEFANEVKLVLYESGSRRRQKNSEKESKKTQDIFTHNFTPPVKTNEAVIRRSLTFSGGRKNDSAGNLYAKPDSAESTRLINSHGAYSNGQSQNKHLLPLPERVTSDGNSWSSNSSLSSQNSTVVHPQHRRQRSTSRDRTIPLHDPGPASLPTYTVQHPNETYGKQAFVNHRQPQYPMNNVSGHFENPSFHHRNPSPHQSSQSNRQHYPTPHEQSVPFNGPVKPNTRTGHSANVPTSYNSAFSVVRPRSRGPESDFNTMKVHNTDIPVYTDIPVKPSSQKSQHVEEYDLDSNFPDVVKETSRDHLIEEYHVPGQQGQGHHRNHYNWEEEERVKLLRLVTMQNERIKMQDSQLEIIDTGLFSYLSVCRRQAFFAIFKS